MKQTTIKKRENVPTPWGKSDGAIFWNKDITQYFTPSHGGMKVNKKLNEKIPVPLRKEDGWYEEDCDVNIVRYFLAAEVQSITDYEFKFHWYNITKEEYFKNDKEKSLESIKHWYPAEWQAFSGEDMTEEVVKNLGSWQNKETALKEFAERLEKAKAEMVAPPKGKIEIGKYIVFNEPISFGKGNTIVSKALIIPYKRKGKALKDINTGMLCRMPEKSYLHRIGYKIVNE